MSLFSQWKSEGGTFAVWKVEESEEELRAMLGEGLPYDNELTRLKAASRRMEYLAVRVLLFTLCGEEKEICHAPSGKPFLADGSFRISISHTKGYVAVGLHPAQEVGVDIEWYSTRVLKVASRFMDDMELQGSNALNETDNVYYPLLHWSAKETIYKLMEEDEVDFKEHIHIRPFRLHEEGELEAEEKKTSGRNYRIHYFLHEGFVCTWAVDPMNKKP